MKYISLLLIFYISVIKLYAQQDTIIVPPSLEADSLGNVLYHNDRLPVEHLEHYKHHTKQSYNAISHKFSFYNKTQVRVNSITKYLDDLFRNGWSVEENASDTIYTEKEFQGDYHGFLFGKHWEEKCVIDLIYYKKDNTTYIINFKNIKHYERRKSDQEWSKKDVSEEKCLEQIKIK